MPNKPKVQKVFCSITGCGKEMTVIGYHSEQVPTPAAMSVSQLERKPPFGELMREFWATCPEHGRRIVQIVGHHVSTIPKRKKAKKQ